jgi:phage terminase small subunit
VEADRAGAVQVGPSGVDRRPHTGAQCRWCAHVDALEKELADTGYMIQGQKGNQVTAPPWRQYRDATMMVVKLAKELGCTPDARLRAASIPIEEEELDELEAILSQPIR